MEPLEPRVLLSAGGVEEALIDYAIVDTGQTECYDDAYVIVEPSPGDAFYGQDAQYLGNQPSYTPGGDGVTVNDNVTGLTWQRNPDTDGDGDIDSDDKFTWSEAQSYADTLNAQNFGGHSDWRLPSIKELYSLIDFSGIDPSGYNGTDTSGLVPFIDTDYFDFGYGDTSAGERIIDAQYWSSTEYVGTTMGGMPTTFGVNFADGRIKGYGRTNPMGGEMTQFVRYVRGNTDYGANVFVDNGNGTVTDTATGLMWMQDDSGVGENWEDALGYGENLEFAGHDDWRLPDAKELQSIVDYTRSPSTTGSAAIDPLFNATSITDEGGEADYASYWTSTTHANWTASSGDNAAYIAFGEAEGWMWSPWAGYELQDVHGAGAQRSDPKTGDPSDYPYGHGPQGDVIRIYNYARAVRYADTADPAHDGDEFTIAQTLSDEAQETTIAFDGLAFLTGDLGADSFLPPGKVADFWGFQYLRDNDASSMGHNTDFLTNAANNMLYVLTDSQVEELVELAESQVDSINECAYMRFPLMDAFRRELAGDVPEGSAGLDASAVEEYSAGLYRLDGEISLQRAEVMGGMIGSLTQDQLEYLDSMVGQGMTSWPDVGDQIDPSTLSHDVHVVVMTYAADLFSWYAGSVDADTYFCPERQGTYFGSFYLKDAPAMGNPNYTIDSNLTADSGRAFLATLTSEQAEMVTDLTDLQRDALYEIVDTREQIATELRRFMAGESADSTTVLALMERYGELDGQIAYSYATTFAEVNQSLTSEQTAQLAGLRTQLGVSVPTGAYLYSEPIAMPEIEDTDFLFSDEVGDQETVSNGYTLFAPIGQTDTYLIDSAESIVHSWSSDYSPALSAYLLEDGSLLRTASPPSPWFAAGGAGGRVEQWTWDGELAWEFDYSGGEYRLHHDVEMLPNGNVLMVAWEWVPEADALAAGRDPNLLTDGELWADHIIEVSPTGASGGDIVWEWHVTDHLVQDYDATQANYGVVADHPELIDVNYVSGRAGADWTHINSIDYNAELDQIMVSVRGFSEIWVIDHGTTTAEAAGDSGDLLYRWGNPQTYDAGTSADQTLFAQHDAQWIADGLPGEDNVLVFNNGTGRDYSSVDEIAPPVEVDGSYSLSAGQSYDPDALTWSYSADPADSFYADHISGAQRLANGNTLVCSGVDGYLFEVTSEGELVWEYDHDGSVFRATRYDQEYAGFDGTALDDEPVEPPTESTQTLTPGRDTASWSFVDEDWDTVTVTLGGRNGSAIVTRGVAEGEQGDIVSIEANGTDLGSVVTISTPRGSETTVGNVVVHGSLGRFDGRTTDLLGSFTVDGTIDTLLFDDVADEHMIAIGRPDEIPVATAIELDHVSDLSIDTDTPIRSLTVTEWLDADGTADIVRAPWIDALTIVGDFEADVAVGGADIPALALGAASIAGNVADSTWTVTGDVGSIAIGDAENWTLAVSGDLESLAMGVFSGAVDVDGDVGSITAHGEVAGSLAVGGNLNRLDAHEGISAEGSLGVGGDLGRSYRVRRRGRRRWVVEGLQSGSDVMGDVSVGGTAHTMAVDGRIGGTVEIGSDADSIVANGMEGAITVHGNVSVLESQGQIQAAIQVDGYRTEYGRVMDHCEGLLGEAIPRTTEDSPPGPRQSRRQLRTSAPDHQTEQARGPTTILMSVRRDLRALEWRFTSWYRCALVGNGRVASPTGCGSETVARVTHPGSLP